MLDSSDGSGVSDTSSDFNPPASSEPTGGVNVPDDSDADQTPATTSIQLTGDEPQTDDRSLLGDGASSPDSTTATPSDFDPPTSSEPAGGVNVPDDPNAGQVQTTMGPNTGSEQSSDDDRPEEVHDEVKTPEFDPGGEVVEPPG